MATDDKKQRMTKPRRRRGRPLQEQRFSSYLTFGFHITACMGIFVFIYVIVLLSLYPLLSEETPEDLKRGEALKPVVDPIIDKLKNLPHEGVTESLKKRFLDSRQKMGLSDNTLIEKASAEIQHLRSKRIGTEKRQDAAVEAAVEDNARPPAGKHAGVVVLGMHRSGTSMLSGLLVTGSGYMTGGPLIGAHFDNEMGFFERIDAVLQNDEFMNRQRVWWSSNVLNYKDDVALADKENGRIPFKNGKKALAFLNDEKNIPWLQKDPRMCITLKTWLALLNNEPAVIFTYRHPLEVAMSLKKRERNFNIERGLRLWILYNMRAIQNSEGLCRVYTSNEAVLADTLTEVRSIVSALTNECGLPAPPREITEEDVNKFVDPNLQHNKKDAVHDGQEVLEDHDGCKVYDYKSDYPENNDGHKRERDLYLMAMKIYCDFKSGAAYKPGYEWPAMQ